MQLFCKQLNKDPQPAHLAAPCPSARLQHAGTQKGPDGGMRGTGAERAQAARREGHRGLKLGSLCPTTTVGMAFAAAASRGLLALLERRGPLFSLHAASPPQKRPVLSFASSFCSL